LEAVRELAIFRAKRCAEKALLAEYDGVHDPSRQQRKQARNYKRAGENRDHDAAMIGDPMAMGATRQAER
jgi:hypothetical protein